MAKTTKTTNEIVERVVMRPLADLVPNPKNPRTVQDEDVAALAESIKAHPRYFKVRPILLSNRTGAMMIIAGERRSEAAKLQIQERLVTEIVTDIERILGTENPPLGVALFMEGEHLCKTMRGAKKEGKMSCCYLTGVFKTEPTTRREFLNICK